jgi:hypothetical protein
VGSQKSVSLKKIVMYTKLILIVALSFGLTLVNAQTLSYGNFKLGDQEIIYQKVFTEEGVTSELLNTFYSALPYISNVSITEKGIEFDVTDITVDFKKFQFKPLDTPSIIQTGKYSGKVAIDVKDGKYRVTFQALELTGDIGYKKITERDKLTTYACRNSGTVIAPEWCRPNMLGLLDKAFTDKLQYVKKEEW